MLSENSADLTKRLYGSGKIQFIFSNWYFPSPVEVVYESNGKLFSRFPSWLTSEFSESIEELKARNNIIKVGWSKKIWLNEYVFAISKDEIIIWSHTHICAELHKRLVQNILSDEESKLVNDYIKNTSN